MSELVLVRHGETEWSRTMRHTGNTDLALTEEGEAQARSVVERLAGRELALVLTSPLQRARRTAELAGYGDRAVPDDDLRERDYGDYEGLTTKEIRRERPGVCAHFIVDRDGTIYQLVSLALICRHTVGLNDRAIGIEHVGFSDAEILGRPAQIRASLRLTRWLQARYGIARRDVIGHAESLSSPYHHERVARLRKQTHGDFAPPAMRRYRARL